MQRTTPDGIIIACDFCATDWDPATGLPAMTEGHHGSVICLECLKRALIEARAGGPGAAQFGCVLCQQKPIEPSVPHWSNPARPDAVVCRDCINQAAGVFHRDPDIDWKWDRKKI